MSNHITRRTFIAAAAAGLSMPNAASALGLPAGPDVVAAFEAMPGISEGRGPGTLHVLFAPWCSASPSLYGASRGVLDRLTIRWIPISGGQPEGREPTEVLLRNMEASLIPSMFTPPRSFGPPLPTPLCDRQDHMAARTVEPLVIRDTSRSLASPTLAYRFRDGRARVIPGGLTLAQLRQVADLAS